LRQDLQRGRHRLSKWLLRRGYRYTQGRAAWTRRYEEWLGSLSFEHIADQATFDDYRLAVTQLEERRKTLEQRLEQLAEQEQYRTAVARLRCFRGIETLTALTLQAELLDFRRFPSAEKLAAYLGVTPSEHSTGGKPKRGSITKTGNSHVRRMLVEAAHHYRHRPGIGRAVRRRREGQPGETVRIATKAEQRLHRRYHRLVARGVPQNKAVVAVARELAGFIWAAMLAPVGA
jgi:transposase